jgi:hypothetical protein
MSNSRLYGARRNCDRWLAKNSKDLTGRGASNAAHMSALTTRCTNPTILLASPGASTHG